MVSLVPDGMSRTTTPIERLRKAVRESVIQRIIYKLDRGEYDDALMAFHAVNMRVSDTLELNLAGRVSFDTHQWIKAQAAFPKRRNWWGPIKRLWRRWVRRWW